MTRNELADTLHWPLSSVCSILDANIRAGRVVSAGAYDTVTWSDGRATRRERFTVR